MRSSRPGTRPDDPTTTAASDSPSTPTPPRHARATPGHPGRPTDVDPAGPPTVGARAGGTAAIATRGVVKTFGRTQALDGLDLRVTEGEVHAFLGPNGAGKSTTIRILLGLLRRDAGDVRLLGRDPWRDAVPLHRRLAYVPGDVHLWPRLTGGEAVDVLCALRGGADRRHRAELTERFQLDLTRRCGTYSKGNRQKVALVAAFACEVPLFILDEPTSGLDPLMESVFREVVRERARDGCTVLLSSHILAEAEALADRVSIIRHGRIVESGTLAQLRHLTRTTVEVTTAEPVRDLDHLSNVHNLLRDGSTARFQVDGDALDPVLRHLTRHRIAALTVTPPTLEELFLRHYGDEPAEVTR